MNKPKNIDSKTVEGFGDEWQRFDQSGATELELNQIFSGYFRLFPWGSLPRDAHGFDLGCGSGRWANFVADKVGSLFCIDASDKALAVAKTNLQDKKNCRFLLASVDEIPLADGSMDFGYSLGVLHHVPDTLEGLKSCASKLKAGAPFLLYLYHALDDMPWWYRALWQMSDLFRGIVSRLPYFIRYWASQLIALVIYLPFARIALVLEKLGFNISYWPLSFYRNLSLYTMRTDALDRFGTRLEKRFSAEKVVEIMRAAGFEKISISKEQPRWCAVGYKAEFPESFPLLEKKKPKLLLLTKYGTMAASSRYRFLQYIPFLEKAGFQCDVSPLLDDEYLTKRFESGQIHLQSVLGGFLRRLAVILKAGQYDMVLVGYELFPYLPGIFERYFSLMGIRYACDYDDAIYHAYDLNQSWLVRLLLKDKIKKIISRAEAVLTGNEYLEAYARQANKNVLLLPTVLDARKYPLKLRKPETSKPFAIGWIGSPSTAKYIQEVMPALRALDVLFDVRFIFIGSGLIELPLSQVSILEWSEESEIEDMLQFDVGIMPLPDTPWAHGKCGFKLLQYMACGLPVVASPVGVNSKIVGHGVNGFLASTTQEWIEALRFLRENEDARFKMGEIGRKRVEDEYCVTVTAPKFVAEIKKHINY